MSNLSDDEKWTSIKVIPHTHNSGTKDSLTFSSKFCWLWSKCQNKTILEQLNMGVRAFDFRLRIYQNEVYISHTLVSNLKFLDVMLILKSFLKKNPTEFIFLFIKPDWPTRNNWDLLEGIKLWINIEKTDTVENGYKNTIFIDKNINIGESLIKDMRGKLTVVPDGRLSNHLNPQFNAKIGTLNINNLNICNTWEQQTLNSAKQLINTFINNFCNNQESDTKFNLIQLNVIAFKGIIPPYLISYFMNKWMINNFDTNLKLGFVSIDFVDENITNFLLNKI